MVGWIFIFIFVKNYTMMNYLDLTYKAETGYRSRVKPAMCGVDSFYKEFDEPIVVEAGYLQWLRELALKYKQLHHDTDQ